MQPIIRGIEAVGSVSVRYKYNGNNGDLKLPEGLIGIAGNAATIKTGGETNPQGVEVSGFRLDSNFLRANPQIASSFQIPILGGGAIALTNNNRSGALTINCTRVSTPVPEGDSDFKNSENVGAMAQPVGLAIGPVSAANSSVDPANVYDLAFLAQVQQAQPGGDSLGSTITVSFEFCGLFTVLQFQGCTIASVDPIGLAGNDAVDYGVQINYLNWTMNTSAATDLPLAE